MRNKPALLMSDGKLVWPLYSILTTECDLDFGDFPYDCQHCSIDFLAFSPDVTLQVSSLKVADNFTDDSSLWCIPSLCPSAHIGNTQPSVEVTLYKVNSTNILGKNFTNSLVKIDITLCRILSYYLWGIYIPYTIVSILIPITFIIPPSREEHEEENDQKQNVGNVGNVENVENGRLKTGIQRQMPQSQVKAKNDDEESEEDSSNETEDGKQKKVVTFNYNERLTFAITLFLTFILFHSTVIADLPKVAGIIWLVKSLSLRMVICGISILYVLFQSLTRKIYPKLRINSMIKKFKRIAKKLWKNSKNQIKPKTSQNNDLKATNSKIGDAEKGNGRADLYSKKADTKLEPLSAILCDSPNVQVKKSTFHKKNWINLAKNLSVYFVMDIFCLVGSTTWLVLLSVNGYHLHGKPYVLEKNLPAEDDLTSLFKYVDLI